MPHRNAPLSETGRLRLARCVVEDRWPLRRAADVDIQLLLVPREPVSTIIWTSRQPIDALARALVRAFDDIARRQGEDGYEQTWGRPFPATELRGLRTAWRRLKASG